jgi:hypothetical protein
LTGKILNVNGYGDCTFQISRYGFRENGDGFLGKMAKIKVILCGKNGE